LKAVRRLLEQDLGLPKKALDEHKQDVADLIDKVGMGCSWHSSDHHTAHPSGMCKLLAHAACSTHNSQHRGPESMAILVCLPLWLLTACMPPDRDGCWGPCHVERSTDGPNFPLCHMRTGLQHVLSEASQPASQPSSIKKRPAADAQDGSQGDRSAPANKSTSAKAVKQPPAKVRHRTDLSPHIHVSHGFSRWLVSTDGLTA
jgi:hypothetical protein